VTDGEGLEIDYVSPDIANGNITISNIVAKGDFKNNSGRLELSLEISMTIETACTRCLEPIDIKLSFPIQENFSQEHPIIDDEDANFINYEHFDIDRYVQQSIFLNLPQKFLCSDECKGLCPICGGNLNKSSCKCETQPIDERFARLQTLIDTGDVK
jgi:uncharacterized protein